MHDVLLATVAMLLLYENFTAARNIIRLGLTGGGKEKVAAQSR
jgi:hypothetical protein